MSPEAFNPREAVAKLVNATPNSAGRKLSFFDQCAAFYALYNNVPQPVVALAFGISRTAVSQIGGCLDVDPRPSFVDSLDGPIAQSNLNKGRNPNRKRRYSAVAEQFNIMGEQAFAEKYYTDAVHVRLMKVKYDVDAEATQRMRRGPDPDANRYSFKIYGSVANNVGELFRIEWVPDEKKPGWYFAQCTPEGKSFWPEWNWQGDHRSTLLDDEPKPFRHSDDIYKSITKINHTLSPK